MKDNELLNAIKEYNKSILENDAERIDVIGNNESLQSSLEALNSPHKAVAYACLRDSFGNQFGALTVSIDHILFYHMMGLNQAIGLSILPIQDIVSIKISKFLIWNNLTVRYRGEDGAEHKLVYKVSNIVVGLKNQKQQAEVLLNYLRERIASL